METINIQNEVNLIWSIANKLRGVYQSDKYKNVIIPFVIIRRFECCLEDSKDKIIEITEADPNTPKQILCSITNHKFYNTSKFNLKELLNDQTNIKENFKNYLNGFSENIQNILKNLEIEKEIEKLDKNNRLYNVIKDFSEIDLHPETVNNIKMGYIFEDLIRRFSENAEAGDHYTGRDIINLMTSLILAEGVEELTKTNKVVKILDQAAGTGGMLTTVTDQLMKFNETLNIKLFSQEINPESYAMCLAEMLIRGMDEDHIKLVDSLKKDCFSDEKMNFVMENPPFGTSWGGKDAPIGTEEAVREENNKANSRYPAGLPSTSDAQLLFMQSAINKLEDNGRAAIVTNGSPLFSGGISSGESQIRKWMLENDYVEAIIQLSEDLFYNTGITTYIWVLSKEKRAERIGKIQLIDAKELKQPLRKSLGNKRYEIGKDDLEKITELYSEMIENDISKIFDNEEFMLKEYTILEPYQRSFSINDETIEKIKTEKALDFFYSQDIIDEINEKEKLTNKDAKTLKKFEENEEDYNKFIDILVENKSDKKIYEKSKAENYLKEILKPIENNKDFKKIIEKTLDLISSQDEEAEILKDKKGNVIYDKDTKDTETINYKEDIDEYMKQEVLPHKPKANYFFEEDTSKKKPVYKSGAEILFNKVFYKFEIPEPTETIMERILKRQEEKDRLLKEIRGV